MRFLSPLDLLWLVPLLGGIVALYLLRKRRQEVVVPSLFLWDRIIQNVQADTPLQRLRPTLLFFLQLLTAFLLILAFAHPYLLGSGLAGATDVIIIDNGARMNATDIAPTRLAEAKRQAEELVSRMSGRDRAMVIASGAHPTLLCPLTGDRRRLSQAISAVGPTDTTADLPGALTLARALLAKNASGARAVVYSDGAWTGDQEQEMRQSAGPIGLRLVSIAASNPQNIGIVAVDARRDIENPAKGFQVFVGLRNFGPDGVTTGRLTLTYSGNTVAVRPIRIAGEGGRQSEVFQSPVFSAGGVVTAALSGLPHDTLAADNTASVVIPPSRTRKVLLVTEGDVFLEKGLGLDPDVALYEVAPKDFATLGHNGAGYNLVVFDSFLPSALPPGKYLVFHAVDSQMPVAGGTDVTAPSVLDWNRTDPVMRFVDLSDLTIRTAEKASPAGWGTVLADADSGPLIVSGQNGQTRVIWVAFSPPDSNFGLSISFPIFLTNALQWLTEDSSTPVGSIQPGQPIALPHGGNWTVATPDGATDSVSCSQSDTACAYAGASRAGLYTASAGSESHVYAVDINSESQSDLTPRAEEDAVAANSALAGKRETPPAPHDIWPWVAVCALALLTLEWLAYHRRL